MHPTLSRAPSLLLVLSAALAAPAPAAAAQDDLGGVVARTLVEAADQPVQELWRRAALLRDVARDLTEEGLDPELDRLLRSDVERSEGARLLLAAARLAGEDAEAGPLADLLEPVLSSARSEYASAAAGLFAEAQFRTLGAERREALLGRLTRLAEDGRLAPQLRLEAAFALFELGWGAERRTARNVMSSFLASGDAELRAQGALTLARTGAEVSGPLYDELRRLARVPDERGRLAASYLEIEDVRREANRKVKRVQEQAQGGDPGAASLATGELSEVESVMTMIERAHLRGDQVTRDQLIEAALDGMLRSLDEHSSFLSPSTYARFEQDLEAGYGGIGAYVGEDRDDGLFTITHPIYSGPAYKAGLLSDDKIVRIDDWPTIGENVDDIIKRLKGRPGTPVTLYVWRRGMDPGLIDRPSDDMKVTVLRDSITIPSVQSQLLPGGLGMVALRDFSRVATQELTAPLQEMMGQGMRAVILDLRNNSGGLLDEAVNVAGLFLPRGSLVVSTESRVAADETLRTSQPPLIPPEMPVIVLVNRFSASAAEIVSGSLQDHGRATLIGKRTFGKGSVQNLLRVSGMRDDVYQDENRNGRHDNWERITKDWNGNGEFDYAPRVKMTIARYRLQPSGRSIHREVDSEGNLIAKGGIEPDLDVDARRMDAWRVEELYKLQREHSVRDYLDELVAQNAERSDWLRERFFQIAENDRKDISLYPGFEAFYEGLETPLPADDVRQLVRAEIRRRVQDARGREFPPGDFVEDQQLQEAIRTALSQLGDGPASYEEYAAIPTATIDPQRLAALGQDSLDEALRQIDAARKGDGRLPEETLARLAELLEGRRTDGGDR